MFALWVQINMQSIQMYEFQAQLQAKTVAKMIEDVEKQKGEGYLIGWVQFIIYLVPQYAPVKSPAQKNRRPILYNHRWNQDTIRGPQCSANDRYGHPIILLSNKEKQLVNGLQN